MLVRSQRDPKVLRRTEQLVRRESALVRLFRRKHRATSVEHRAGHQQMARCYQREHGVGVDGVAILVALVARAVEAIVRVPGRRKKERGRGAYISLV